MIEEIFGSKHEVYIGVELTKRHEKHYTGEVLKIREQIENENEGSRIKGEVTMVLAPYDSIEQKEQEAILKKGGFDPKRDVNLKIDVMKVA